MMKKVFFLTGLLIILFLSVSEKMVYASPFYTPSFRFLPADELQLCIKEIYTRENDFGMGNVAWRSDTEADLHYGISKNAELDVSLPYISGAANKQSGLKDSLLYFKYRIFSSQEEFYADRDLDIALQLGCKVRAGEVDKGLRGKETDLLFALLGRYEIGKLKSNYYFYFHFGEWFPVEGNYKYKDFFQYDFAVECRLNRKISYFIEYNGQINTDYDLKYFGPGIQFRPGADWEINLSFAGSISDKGGFLNSKSGLGIAYVF